jgi:hypothetical protein
VRISTKRSFLQRSESSRPWHDGWGGKSSGAGNLKGRGHLLVCRAAIDRQRNAIEEKTGDQRS